MPITTLEFTTGMRAGMKPGEELVNILSIYRGREVSIPELRLHLTGYGGLYLFSREIRETFTGDIVFDAFPLLEVDGANVVNEMGAYVTLSTIGGYFIRLENLGGGTGSMIATGVDLSGDSFVKNFASDGVLVGAANSSGEGVSGTTSLTLSCDGMNDMRITVLLVGANAGEGEYYPAYYPA